MTAQRGEPAQGQGERVTIRCHRCRSTQVALTEVTDEFHQWDGVVLIDGTLAGTGECVHTAGEITSTILGCLACGHSWKPRRRVGDPEAYR